ncbi:uncharacterized protein METZ01_LOCUS228687, partial [marine metagenome]
YNPDLPLFPENCPYFVADSFACSSHKKIVIQNNNFLDKMAGRVTIPFRFSKLQLINIRIIT